MVHTEAVRNTMLKNRNVGMAAAQKKIGLMLISVRLEWFP